MPGLQRAQLARQANDDEVEPEVVLVGLAARPKKDRSDQLCGDIEHSYTVEIMDMDFETIGKTTVTGRDREPMWRVGHSLRRARS